MFDGLRNNDNDNSSGFNAPVEFFPDETPAASKPRPAPKKRKSSGKFLGMTPQQRFILAVILMITVCLLGSMCMLITGRFVLPL
ncbi:MAG: hypothetical protein HFACDABA_01926 [Anaerolineales bacterium]|nr:hypothetical protein [Anaerolineales bacterium]